MRNILRSEIEIEKDKRLCAKTIEQQNYQVIKKDFTIHLLGLTEAVGSSTTDIKESNVPFCIASYITSFSS